MIFVARFHDDELDLIPVALDFWIPLTDHKTSAKTSHDIQYGGGIQ